MSLRTTVLFIIVAALFAGCAQRPVVQRDSAPSRHAQDIPSEPVVPRVEPRSKYGNPPSYVVHGNRYYVMQSSQGYLERGIASWYGTKFHGRRTSSGETYNMYGLTAAHKSLPLPTYVRVTNLQNRRSIVVKVNDRGPFHSNRIIDLSYGAAVKLGIIAKGTGLVEVRALDPRTYHAENEQPEPRAIKVVAVTPTVDKTPVEHVVEGNPKIYLQVGAFRTPENAARLRSELAAENMGKVTVFTTDLDGAPIHRVKIGPLESIESSDMITQRIEGMGYSQHHIIIE